MYFKNLQPYRLPADWAMSAAGMAQQLARRPFQSCGSQDAESRGWVPPCPLPGEPWSEADFVHVVGGQWLVCLQTETKILPSAVVQQEAERRADEIAQQQGFRLGRKQMKELREQITSELLPRAFTRTRKVFAWIDPAHGWLVVDAPSQSRAEDVLEALRQTLESLPLSLVRTVLSPAIAMSGWLANGEATQGLTIDQDCTLQSVTDDRRTVTYKNGIDDEQIREHLEAGKLPTKLALTFDDRLSFVLTDALELKRLEFLDVVKEQVDQGDAAADAQSIFDAQFTLMTAECVRLLSRLADALGGELTKEQ